MYLATHRPPLFISGAACSHPPSPLLNRSAVCSRNLAQSRVTGRVGTPDSTQRTDERLFFSVSEQRHVFPLRGEEVGLGTSVASSQKVPTRPGMIVSTPKFHGSFLQTCVREVEALPALRERAPGFGCGCVILKPRPALSGLLGLHRASAAQGFARASARGCATLFASVHA
jgi:hypothetical protein